MRYEESTKALDSCREHFLPWLLEYLQATEKGHYDVFVECTQLGYSGWAEAYVKAAHSDPEAAKMDSVIASLDKAGVTDPEVQARLLGDLTVHLTAELLYALRPGIEQLA